MGRYSFRNRLIASGTQTVHRRGFASVGVREITAAAKVAQGSFTNHFASKEEFGVAVMDHYTEQIQSIFQQTLRDKSRPPLARLQAYFETIVERFAENDWRYGCLAGNMALEAAEHSESIRERVRHYLDGAEAAFTDVINEAQRSGHLQLEGGAQSVAAALLEAWHGAMLRMKVERSPASLQRFLKFTLPVLLGLPAQRTLCASDSHERATPLQRSSNINI